MATKKRPQQTERGKRLEKALNDAGYVNYAAFGREMGASSAQAVNNWLVRGIAAHEAPQAAALLGKTPEWLLAKPSAAEYPLTPEEQAEISPALGLSKKQQALIAALIVELRKVPR